MDRAYQSGAAVSAPSAPASPSTGYPTAGNPGSGTPATTPGPYWYHMIMEELMAVISAAGIEPAQGNLTQLLTALRSAGVFQTAPQFDNDTSVATTEFVQRAMGNFSGALYYTTAQTLTAANTGKAVICAGTFNLTLPLVSTAPSGKGFLIQSQAGVITIARQGLDTISIGSVSAATSLTLGSGDWAYIYSNGAGQWVIAYGTPLLTVQQTSGVFGANLTAYGYQKLPSGLIIQWGVTGSITGGGSATVTYPIAFPNGPLVVTASLGAAANSTTPSGAGIQRSSATQLIIRNLGVANFAADWIAIGY